MKNSRTTDEMPAKPVGIWIRVSTEDQAKGESPEHHEKRALYYAKSKGWKVKEVYHLEATSGKSVSEHPETKRMLDHIKSGYITGLIFSKLARLARNTKELLDFADYFRENNADLISLQEAIDTSTPAGRLFYTMIAAMAQWEREEISERVAASVPIRAKLGKPLGGQAPFGYQWKDKKLIPNPKEAPVRKLIYELFLEHKRKRTVAGLLNEAGYRTRNGSKFSGTTVTRLLQDPTAKGEHRSNYTKSQGNNKKWELKPEKDWIINEIEPIITIELWDQCNAIINEQKQKNKQLSRKAVHLFTGIVFCHCGNKMYVPSSSPKYTCYKCRNKIIINDLERLFHEQLKNFFYSPTQIAEYLNSADKMIKEKEELFSVLEDRQRKIQLGMDKVYQLYLDDQITKEGFGKRYKPMEEQLKQLEREIPELQGEIDFLKIQFLSSDQILAEAKDLYTRWPQLVSDEKRKIVESITEKIVIGKTDVSINLCYLPSPDEMMTSSQHNLIVALPFCHVELKAQRRVVLPYPTTLKTLGDHIRKRRLDLGLNQKEVSKIIGTIPNTICSWENNSFKPSICFMPKIIDFLSYALYTPPQSLREKLITYRQFLGITQKKLAKMMGVNATSIRDWEKGIHRPRSKSLEIIERFFKEFF